MKNTRWKWMIGGLGLSLGGLAAIAGNPTQNTLLSCEPTKIHTVAHNGNPPVSVPAPKVNDIKTSPAVTPAPLTIPMLVEPPVAVPVPPAPIPGPVAPIPAPTGPAMLALPSVSPIAIPPTIPAPEVKPIGPAPIVMTPTAPSPLPEVAVPGSYAINPTRAVPLEAAPGIGITPAVVAPPAINPSTPSNVPLMPLPLVEQKPPVVEVKPTSRKPEPVPVPTPARPSDLPPVMSEPQPTTSADVRSAGPVEKKLKVILYMSDERPRFEVRDGDEVYLKVVCNHVEVKSPGEKGSNLSTMKATGNVRFITPGGEGTCSDLTVLPGTGSVQVNGNVIFTHNWGKLETTVSGESMTFRLGAVSLTPTTPSGLTRTSFEKLP
ncbi:MAG: hypothetical protein ACRC8S_10150 [Fimbriiglobus sp.]